MGTGLEGINPDLIKAGVNVASGLVKDSVQGIITRINSAKAAHDKEKTINSLDEIITELLAERNQLVQTLQAYEEILITQKISDNEIEYITDNIIPLIETLAEQNGGEDTQKTIEMLKPLLSKELFNILQLLGFNFKQAVGEPLTKLINTLITSKVAISSEVGLALQLASTNKDAEFFKMVQDEDSYQRYLKAIGRA
ncbi:hypothetical protein SLT67_14275 [Paenibacillus illinoisensis]|uniref:hypothetical protein n=1 Tax=Paenibacillus illinoisensis TaxID=59845 RepID=UPI003CF046A0